MKQAFFSIFIAIGFVFSAQARQLPPFQLKDGDRVVVNAGPEGRAFRKVEEKVEATA